MGDDHVVTFTFCWYIKQGGGGGGHHGMFPILQKSLSMYQLQPHMIWTVGQCDTTAPGPC
jgi:uncharacterized membrane protein